MSKLLAAAAAAVANGVSMETSGGDGNVSFYWVDESRIIDNPYQYRMFYETEKMLELAENIHTLKNDLPTLGLEQVPFARLVRLVDGDYIPLGREEIATHEQILYWLRQDGVLVELMFGHRRRRAWTIIRHGMLDGCARLKLEISDEQRTRYFALAGDADYAVMPLHIGYADNQQMWKHAVSENRHRSDVTAIEEAEAMATAKAAFRYTDGQIGEIFGYARSTVANKMRLLDLPEEVRNKMISGEISERAGRTVLALKDDPEKLATAIKVSEGSIDKLEWEVKRQSKLIEGEKAMQRQAETLRAMGWRVVEKDEKHQKFSQWGAAPSDLLHKKRCGKNLCPCFAACYDLNAWNGQRVDEQNAPDFVAACTDPATAQQKYQQLMNEQNSTRVDKEAERKEKAQRVRAEVEQRWKEETSALVAAAGSKRLYTRPEFWKVVVEHLFHWQGKQARTGDWKTMDGLESALLADMLYTFLEYKSGAETYNAKKVDELINRLAGVVAT